MKTKANRIFITSMLMILLVSVIVPKGIAASYQEETALKLVDLEIMKGYDSNQLGLEDPVKRAQMVTLIMRVEGKENEILSSSQKLTFKDVSAQHWARQSIQNAVILGFAQGYDSYTFGPEDPVKYEQVCAFMLRLLGQDKDLPGKYPDNYINKAKELGITNHVEIKVGQAATRGDVAAMLWNTLFLNKNR